MNNSPLNPELHEFASAPDKLKKLAKSTIDKFDEVSTCAMQKIEIPRSSYAGSVFASSADEVRGFGSQKDSLENVYNENLLLREEPVIARVAIQHSDTNEIEIFYFCRYAPPTGVKNAVSRNSPLGRLAALNVGETHDLGEETGLPNWEGKDVLKVSHAVFIPSRKGELWDSRKTEYRDGITKEVLTIDSLRRLFEESIDDSEDFLDKIFAEDDRRENIVQGTRRDIVKTLSLRDQPILDQYQDEIFRLPLQYSLLLLGPAGSGKTTTLIRRLGQKLDREQGLTENERHLVEQLSDVSSSHERSWLMFTPSDLLKSYLQEAFNRERIPAPDHNITTWESYRIYLGRDVFKILHISGSESGLKSGFQYDSEVLTLTDGQHLSKDMYDDFYTWMIADYAKEVLLALEGYAVVETLKNNKVLAELLEIAKKHLAGSIKVTSFFREILKHKNDISTHYEITKKNVNSLIDQELMRELRTNQKILEELSSYLKSLSQREEDIEEQDDTIADVFDGDEEIFSSSDLRKARAEYRRILLYLAQGTSENSKGLKSSKIMHHLEWLGERRPNSSVLTKLHSLAAEAKIFGFLSNPLGRFFRTINVRYRKFRKLRQSESIWYNPDSSLRNKIDSTELDILILTNLMASHELLSSSDIYRNTSDSWLTALEPAKSLYVNQILIDEAPDFSPLQLGCMKLLSHPHINSFFACGDFNQRLIASGTKSLEDLKNFLPGKTVEIRKINTSYRQSKKLYDLSIAVLKMIGSELTENTQSNSSMLLEGFSPVLGEELEDTNLAVWIADRIIEIEKILGFIPSIAILVPEEKYVRPVSESLRIALKNRTTAIVQACYEGQTKGNERAIRVFDIKHIKGLEFEAAFFVAIDRLNDLYPDLLGNYLYVGATRAATFLGVSCEHSLPESVAKELKIFFATCF